MEAQDRDLRIVHGRKPGIGKEAVKAVTGETGPQEFFGFTYPDKVQRIVANRAVMTQLAGRSASA